MEVTSGWWAFLFVNVFVSVPVCCLLEERGVLKAGCPWVEWEDLMLRERDFMPYKAPSNLQQAREAPCVSACSVNS